MNNISVIGIDLAKKVFQICGLNKANKVQFNKSVKRSRFIDVIRQYPNALLVMEACGSANHWARSFTQMGYEVRLIPAQHVKAMCRGNKSDANDALAIAESANRPNLYPAQIKTLEQQDYQVLLRIRTRYKESRTATINQARGLLTEYGVVMATSIAAFHRDIPLVLEDAENSLTPIARSAIHQLYLESIELTQKIANYDQQLQAIAKTHPTMQSLMKLRGIGPITAVALVACMGNGHQFNNARQLAAWVGLVPKQNGTGGKMVLGPMSKRENRYLRLLLIHGARTVMNWMKHKSDAMSLWAKGIIERRGKHKAIVAIANKTARMIWVVLRHSLANVPKQYLSAA